ncbi:tumor protein p53 inducible nuclear protein isoform X2 [Andrena cerasifolii]
MLSNLANYLLGGNISSAQDAREGSNNESPESLPVMARLSQVEVEGDDWILIDPAVEGATALEESWYVTPPACFTWAGPVNVETSPLEDLLIEHPSMSVYRATASPVAPDTPPPTPDEPEARDAEEDALIPAVSVKTKGQRVQEDVRTPVASAKTKERDVKEHISNRAVTAALERSPGRTENDQQSRRPAIHDGRPAVDRVRTEKRITLLRSAQKVFEKRSTQLLKRSHLERSNKLSEVFSVRGKRPRRQDRLRIQNSGVNNNRKCC